MIVDLLAPAAITDIGHDRAWWEKEAARLGTDWPGVIDSAHILLAIAGLTLAPIDAWGPASFRQLCAEADRTDRRAPRAVWSAAGRCINRLPPGKALKTSEVVRSAQRRADRRHVCFRSHCRQGIGEMSDAGKLKQKLEALAAKRGEPTSADNVSSKPWNEGLITARALQSKQFKPVRIILPKLIPEGVTLLAGKPKVGKSWLALDVCLAVADESRFVLGDTRPVHGNALYLALEDNERRLHWRIKKIVQGQPQWPEWLDLRTEWRRVDEGGLEDIEAWCQSVKQPRLIWIDTLPKIRPLRLKGREQAYSADYRAMEGLQALAGRRQLGIVVNAHLRKAASEDDPIDDINGTLGLTGAADTAIVLKRQSGMVKIYLRGRDIEEAELAAEFNRETCRWRIVGGSEEAFRSQERQAVIAALKEAGTDKTGKPNAMTLDDILAATERSDRSALRSLLHKMRKANEVVSPRVGYHALPGDPLNSVDAVDGAASEPVGDNQGIDHTTVSETALRQRGRQRGVNGNEMTIPFPSRSTAATIAAARPASRSGGTGPAGQMASGCMGAAKRVGTIRWRAVPIIRS